MTSLIRSAGFSADGQKTEDSAPAARQEIPAYRGRVSEGTVPALPEKAQVPSLKTES